jgi:hypothetical protein
MEQTLLLDHLAQGGGDLLLGRRLADQALDDGRRGIRCDRAHIAHGGTAGRGDRSLRRREPLVELGLDALLRFLRLCGLPLTRRVRDRLGAGAGVASAFS